MTIFEQIKADQLQARKARDTVAASLLTTFIGESTTLAKNASVDILPDAETIKLLQKFIKNINLTVEAAGASDTTNRELAVLREYLPPMLSEDEITAILKQYKASLGDTIQEKQMRGELLKFMKSNYAGRYDGATAARIANTI